MTGLAAGEALPAEAGRRKVFGRRRGKALRPVQTRLLETLLPALAVPGVAPRGDPARAPIDPAALFGGPRPVWLEIGFGAGEHLAHQATLHPEVGLIGAEPFVNGVAMALARIEAAGLGNVRIHPGDARDLLELLPEASVARAFLLYPDPWPKTRHRERRFANPENLAALARVLAPGAELRLATDIEDYARRAVAAATSGGAFATAAGPAGRAEPWPDWVRTRFEARALREGRTPRYCTLVRRTEPLDRAGPIR